MSAFIFVEVHKDEIKVGDVILHNDKEMTVCNSDLRYCSFMGRTIFGDSYSLGYKKVLKGIYKGAI